MSKFWITNNKTGEKALLDWSGSGNPTGADIDAFWEKYQASKPPAPLAPVSTQLAPVPAQLEKIGQALQSGEALKAALPAATAGLPAFAKAGMKLSEPPLVRPALEIGGATVGGLGGAAIGGPLAPVTGLAGEALGYAAGKQAADFLEATRAGKQFDTKKGLEALPGDIAKGAVFSVAGGVAGRLAKSASDVIVNSVLPPLSRAVSKAIDYGVAKGIKPAVTAKQTIGQAQKYLDDAKTAVKAIVANFDDIKITDAAGSQRAKLPETLNEFAQAIDQTKRKVFEKYDAMAQGSQIQVTLGGVIKELSDLKNSKYVQDVNRGLASHIDGLIESFKNRGAYTPKEAQDIMSNLNAGLQNFYRSPNYNDIGKTSVDALVANNLRKSLDDTIEKTSGPQYSALKRVYGSLKAIEKDVNHRAIVDMRKNEKGLIDFTDIFSGSKIAESLVSMNPASLAAGATSGFISRLYKRMNDPNNAIKTMFERVKNLPLREAQRAGIEETAAGIAKTAGKGGGYIGANTLPGLFVSPASAEGKEDFSVTPKTQQGQKLYQDAQRSYLNKDFQQARDSVFKLMQAEPRLAPVYARSIDLINREEFGMKKRGLI